MSSSRRRQVLAAGALLATAALAAAPLHAADAARPAHPAAQRDTTLTVTVSTSKTSTTLSASTITPGNTVFSLVGVGGVDVVTFKGSYTLADFAKDAKKLFSGDVKTIRRVDKGVVFWGGMVASAAGSQVGMDLPAGSYTVLNIDKGTYAALTVEGTPEARTLPTPGGKVDAIHEMTYKADANLPHKGWITFNNKASEPHFLDMEKIKQGTTPKQVKDYLLGGAQGRPKFALGEAVDTLPVSPGHSFQFYVDVSKGEWTELCFWPSKRTGMPHSLMGMFDISQLS